MAFPQLPDQSADLDDLCRVKAHGRLVQNDELRRAQQCLRNAHALAVALGQTADEPGQHLFQPGAAGSFAHLFFAVGLLFDAFQPVSYTHLFVLLLTNSSNGVNRHSPLSTALNASVSQLLCSRNSAVSTTQQPAKETCIRDREKGLGGGSAQILRSFH